MLHLLAIFSLCTAIDAYYLKGFTGNTPRVLNNDPDLVLEQIWALDLNDMPTHIEWVPGSSQVVTTQKIGFIRLYESVDADVDDYIELIDMRPDVWSYGDHGIMNLKFHPEFENGVQKAFILYTGEPKDVYSLPNYAAIFNSRPDGWGDGPPGTTGYTWLDYCPCLECSGTGANRYGAICEHPYYVDRVAVDLDAGVMTKEVTLIELVCASGISHGPGSMLFIDGDLYVSAGDGSQYSELDTGFYEDGCYNPNLGLDQGVFRAQREEFGNGKLTRIPAELIDSDVQLTSDQVTFAATGLRQPFRMYYRESDDILWIGDIGYGDGGTTERIFYIPGISMTLPGFDAPNFGWPCIEGLYSSAADALLGLYNPWDTVSEQTRIQFLDNNNLDTCRGVQLAVEALVGGTTPDAEADPLWNAPFYEYRVGALDPDYPYDCASNLATISSVFYYDGDSMPEAYTGKLIFSDYVEQCIWYFDNDADGFPDTSTPPHIITAQMGFIDMQVGPDGAIYGIDYPNARIVRMYQQGTGPSEDDGPTPPPTSAPTSAPFDIPTDIPDAEMCFDPKNMPEFEWTKQDDGSYEGNLTIDAVYFETDEGYVRTRAYNGMIPGPLMRMQPCGTYKLNLYNAMDDWPTYTTTDLNVMKDPTLTNLHLHGMHISGMSPGDDVFAVVMPGQYETFEYTVPCDHSSGTNWYHPHHHGATTLQLLGGAAGLLVISPSAREASTTPTEIQIMPEQYIVVQEFEPVKLDVVAKNSDDKLYETNILNSFMLVNGCSDAAAITLEAGKWTRLKMLNVGYYYNSLYTVQAVDTADEACSLMLLEKDGVPVADAPRDIADNKMFMSLSSRLDVAIQCPTAGAAHQLLYDHINDILAPEESIVLAEISVIPSTQVPADVLPEWNPCRPAYLTDVYNLPESDLADLYLFEVRESLNGELFTSPDTYLFEMSLGVGYPWGTSGSDQHPFHTHVNHMQFGSTVDNNQWPEVPGWNVAGDWVDTLSAPGVPVMYVKPERYTGRMVMHCHISEHADSGITGVANLVGDGDDGEGDPDITDFGTCLEEIPISSAYNDERSVVPGTIEAEYFDDGGEGIAYHNINIDENTSNVIRLDTAVEIRSTADDVTYVGSIRKDEWLKYSVTVKTGGDYVLRLNIGSDEFAVGLHFSLWLDADECPPRSQDDAQLLAVDDEKYTGTGSYDAFELYDVSNAFALEAGDHSITFCFDVADAHISFDSFQLVQCLDENACTIASDSGVTFTASSESSTSFSSLSESSASSSSSSESSALSSSSSEFSASSSSSSESSASPSSLSDSTQVDDSVSGVAVVTSTALNLFVAVLLCIFLLQ